MDETTIRLDAPANYTYDRKGKKQINSVTSGCEKVGISVSFCAAADGTKLPALIIIPRKFPLKNFNPPENVLVHYKQGSSTFNSEIISDVFFKRVLNPHIVRKGI